MKKFILVIGIVGLSAAYTCARQQSEEVQSGLDLDLLNEQASWANTGRGGRGGHSHGGRHSHNRNHNGNHRHGHGSHNGHRHGGHGNNGHRHHDQDDNWNGGHHRHRHSRGSWNNRGMTGYSSYGGGGYEGSGGGYEYPVEENPAVLPAVRPVRVIPEVPRVGPVNIARAGEGPGPEQEPPIAEEQQ